ISPTSVTLTISASTPKLATASFALASSRLHLAQPVPRISIRTCHGSFHHLLAPAHTTDRSSPRPRLPSDAIPRGLLLCAGADHGSSPSGHIAIFAYSHVRL